MTHALLFTALLSASIDQTIHVGERLSQEGDLVHYVKERCPLGIHSAIPFVVKVNAILDIDGRLRNFEFVSGDPHFRKESLRVLSLWRYKPVIIDG